MSHPDSRLLPALPFTRAVALAVFVGLAPGLSPFTPLRAADNVLLIIADDFGADSCSLYNSASVASLPPTPHLEALGRSGIVFAQAWANPVCSPTRASLMTGRHAFRTGIGNVIAGPGTGSLAASEVTLPDAFATPAGAGLGFETGLFGKWHLGGAANGPRTLGGWTQFAGSLQGAIPNYTNWTKTVNGTSTANHAVYATTDAVNEAITWIQSRAGQPWFACIAFNAPHTPYHRPPASLAPTYSSLTGTQIDINNNPRAYYEAAVEAMDTELGRLLNAIPRTNTHILFIGDNGTPRQVLQPPYAGNRGKDTLYESGVRVPCIIAGPAVTRPNRTNSTPVHVVDLFPTILELAGLSTTSTVPAEVTLDGASLLPVLRDAPSALSTRQVFTEVFDNDNPSGTRGRAIRDAQWKLIAFDDGSREFYELPSDPYELTNLLASASGLSSPQSYAYNSLSLELANFQSVLTGMTITNFAASPAGGIPSSFSVAAAWTTNVQHTLWRTTAPATGLWTPVPNATSATNFNSRRIVITDPAPPATSPTFYRLTTWSPIH